MIDLGKLDALFEESQRGGRSVHWSFFANEMLIPLSALPEAVRRETGELVSTDDLRRLVADRWFLPFQLTEGPVGEQGVPLYVPSRVGILLKLRRLGWSSQELRAVAESEDWTVANVLTADQLAYFEDDIETLLVFARDRLDVLQGGRSSAPASEGEIAKARSELEFLGRLRGQGIPEGIRPVIAKHAFHVRAVNDSIRAMLFDMDRTRLQAGYSPFVLCRSAKWEFDGGFEGEGVLWEETIGSAVALSTTADEDLPIRVPGFLLKGEQILPTYTMRPQEYADLWRRHELDVYLERLAEIRGERCCLNCHAALSGESSDRKKFCGERCRNAAKQRRFRARNPESIERTQKKYWESLDLNTEEPS